MLLRVDEPSVADYLSGHFGRLLPQLRDSLGLTVLDMADVLGVSRPTYYGYLAGRSSVSIEALFRLAMIADLPYDQVMPPRALILRSLSCPDGPDCLCQSCDGDAKVGEDVVAEVGPWSH